MYCITNTKQEIMSRKYAGQPPRRHTDFPVFLARPTWEPGTVQHRYVIVAEVPYGTALIFSFYISCLNMKVHKCCEPCLTRASQVTLGRKKFDEFESTVGRHLIDLFHRQCQHESSVSSSK
jgi:hypothetical protein